MQALIEILATRSNKEIRDAKAIYNTKYGDLDKDVRDSTSGHFKELLEFLVKNGINLLLLLLYSFVDCVIIYWFVCLCFSGQKVRAEQDETEITDRNKAERDAQMLYDAGEGKMFAGECSLACIDLFCGSVCSVHLTSAYPRCPDRFCLC